VLRDTRPGESRMLSLLDGQPACEDAGPAQTASPTRAPSRWWAFRWPGLPRGRDPLARWAVAAGRGHGARAQHGGAHLGAGDQPGGALQAGARKRLAWVTTLDKGRWWPAPGAVSDCAGGAGPGRTDAQGLATFNWRPSPPARRAPARNGGGEAEPRPISSAPAPRARRGGRLAFTWSDWKRGIEPWRFNVPTSQEPAPTGAPTPCSTARCCAPARPCR
jgi:hypothetical protein